MCVCECVCARASDVESACIRVMSTQPSVTHSVPDTCKEQAYDDVYVVCTAHNEQLLSDMRA